MCVIFWLKIVGTTFLCFTDKLKCKLPSGDIKQKALDEQ